VKICTADSIRIIRSAQIHVVLVLDLCQQKKSDFHFDELTNVSNWKPNQELDSDLFDISPPSMQRVKVGSAFCKYDRFIPKEKLVGYYVFYFSEFVKIYNKSNELQSF
jgi:hypothetical protein